MPNRATRRAAAAIQRRKDYGLLYYEFRGKWSRALHTLLDAGYIVHVRHDDGSSWFKLKENVQPGEVVDTDVSRFNHGKFLTSPDTVAMINRFLQTESEKTHGTGKRKRKRR